MLPEDVVRPAVPVVRVQLLDRDHRVGRVSTPGKPVDHSLDKSLVMRVVHLCSVEPATARKQALCVSRQRIRTFTFS